MERYRGLIFLLTIAFSGCGSIPLQKADKIDLKEIEIYSDFEDKGYTTAGAYTHFDDLEVEKIEKIEVSFNDFQTLKRIIKNSAKSKHHQTKLGMQHIFALFRSETNNESRVVFNIGSESIFIVDLSNMVQYEITNIPDVLWIKEFRTRIQ